MTKSTKTTIRGEEVRNLIVERHDFHAGGKAYRDTWNFRGMDADLFTPFMNMGYLPASYAEALSQAKRDGDLTFIVFSYGTPIAWHDNRNGWTVPAHKYSISTTAHQSTVRRALHAAPYNS